MRSRIEIGQRFGKLVVTADTNKRTKHGNRIWLCTCDCGKTKEVVNYNLTTVHVSSCGCEARFGGGKDLTGQKFGSLVVIADTGKKDKHRNRIWLCRCDCGCEKELAGGSLTSKNIKNRTCGCGVVKRQIPNLDNKGYVWVRSTNHPNSSKNGYVQEHVLVMSEMIGRALTEDEHVHHKNGIRHDNNPSNLELWSGNHPAGQRVEDMLEWIKSYLAEHGGPKTRDACSQPWFGMS